eukprot:c20231_g2_i2.p1 GENE.c20231_g2_i2~~c20231_g2_i2.p1  ORF type:complete len:373 (+),score=173.19 c20231_g2_i2:129-1247(+)
MSTHAYVLAGDIGGTNSRFVLYDLNGGPHRGEGHGQGGAVVYQNDYHNHKYENFTLVVQEFLKDSGNKKPKTACFAVAGPVKNNVVVLTNIQGWVIDGHALEKSLSIAKVKIINDFSGIGYGLLTLEDSECVILNKGIPKPEAPIICVGAGTGLGECFLVFNKDKSHRSGGYYEVYPTEGGHTDYAANNQLHQELRDFIKKQHNSSDRLSVERVVSGGGIASTYDFLRTKFPGKGNPKTIEKFDSVPFHERPIVVSSAVKARECPLADQAVDIFLDNYGSEVGNCALKWLPYGGIYIAGGLLPRYLDRLPNSSFLKSCFSKGRMSKFVEEIPIKVVTDGYIGLRGAKLLAARMLNELEHSQTSQENPSRSRL